MDYSKEILPVKYKLFGVDLQPFSMGHYLVLKRFDSPLIKTGAAMNLAQLIASLVLGVLVCSMTHKEFKSLDSKKVDSCLSAIRTRLKKERINPVHKLKLFNEYASVDDCVPQFELMGSESDESSPKTLGGDWTENVIITMTRLGYSFDEVMELPLRVCLSHYFVFQQQEGNLRILTDEENEIAKIQLQEFERRRKELEAQKGSK